MVDIHCHILPGFDDGSDNIEESLRMARIAAGGGTKAIIVTPHSNISDSHKNYLDKAYVDTFKELKAKIREHRIPLEIFPGHEIFATDDMIEPIKKKKLLTLCNSDYTLVEFGFKERSESVYRKLQILIAEGLTPIVAHPERYAFVAENGSAPLILKKMGCLLQVNKGSLKNKFGDNAYAVSQALIIREVADFVASDAHSPYVRTPYLADVHEIISDLHSVQYADQLLSINPGKILRNEKIK
jgi:protein-tyrosine phosphatase